MTAIERAFLDDIAAQPQDDFPRLAYADWLEEHGDEKRAEFIRVQCELAAHPDGDAPLTSNNRVWDLRRRERELWTACAVPLDGIPDDWIPTLSRDAGGIRCDDERVFAIYRRGFISRITLPCATFIEHAADIIESVPMLEEVRLSDCPLIDAGDSRFSFQLPESLWENPHFAYLRRQFRNEDRAMQVMSRYCLAFAHDQLAARRDFRPGIVATTAR